MPGCSSLFSVGEEKRLFSLLVLFKFWHGDIALDYATKLLTVLSLQAKLGAADTFLLGRDASDSKGAFLLGNDAC